MPKISVIIPVYNVEKYLKRCLDSIVNQSLKDIEIICINDGSTDRSLNILQEYAQNDSRIKIINKENQGLSCARNDGTDISTGEYIGFVDSDDYIDLNFYEKLYEYAQNNNADIAVAGIKKANNRYCRNMLTFPQLETAEDFISKIKLCNVPDFCHVWNKIYKRELITKTGLRFVPDRIYEDLPYTPQILYASKKLVTVPDIYYYYWRGSNSLIKKGGNKAKQDYIKSEAEIINFFEKINLSYFDYKTIVKRYKLFGFTVYKSLKNNLETKHIVLNFICWKTKNKN